MILTCPSCAASFVVDPQKIGPAGRRVRCSKCRHEWHASPPAAAQAAEGLQPAHPTIRPVPKGSALPVVSNALAVSPRRSAAFGVAAAVLIALPLLAWKLAPYMTPHVSVAQQMLGIALDGTPTTALREEEGREMLNIEGALINRGVRPQKVPVLKASALNARGNVVREWTIPLTAAQLEAGQRLPFSFSTPLSEQGVEDITFHLM